MIASHTDVVPASEVARWEDLLAESEGYDFYHLPGYHSIKQEGAGENDGMLFVYREGPRMAAWPFLLRTIPDLGGLEGVADGLNDATSVYGYPGPIFSPHARSDYNFLHRFGRSLHQCARDLHIVSLFSRTNPLLGNAVRETDIGILVPKGDTVSVDLSESMDDQWSHIRANHRRGIRRAMEKGVRVIHDHAWGYFDQFIDLYQTTMKHVGAAPQYFFDRTYFVQLRNILGERLNLFVALYDGMISAGALFVHTGPIIQYHLSGTNLQLKNLASPKLIVNEVRLWGKARRARYLHLGGGVGGRPDTLLLFKTGFSRLRHKFFVWQHVVEPGTYATLVEARRSWLLQNGLTMESNEYFPLYRANGHPIATAVCHEVSAERCVDGPARSSAL